MAIKHIMLFPNGMTAVFDENGQQVPELQQPWFRIYLEWLEEQNVELETATFTMPDGSQARPYLEDGRYLWKWTSRPRPPLSEFPPKPI